MDWTKKSALILLGIIALGATALWLFNQQPEAVQPNTHAGRTAVDISSDQSATTPDATSTSEHPDATSTSEYQIPHGPIVTYVTPTIEQMKWATETYLAPDYDYGYENVEFVEIDVDLLLQKVRASSAYLASASGKEPADFPPKEEPDFWLELFGNKYPMQITKAHSVTRMGTEFVNARGHYFPIEGHPFTDIPGPSSWRLNINVPNEWVTVDIKTSTHLVIVQPTHDYTATAMAYVSSEEYMKFPPID